MDPEKARFAQPTDARTLGRDHRRRGRVPGLVGRRRAEARTWCSAMAPRPLILALANPTPEILPERGQGGARAMP